MSTNPGLPIRFLFGWVLVTIGSLAFVGAMGHYPSDFASEFLRFDYPAATFGFILGGISGAIVGVPQWLILRRRWRVRRWVPALVLSFGVRHALGDGAAFSTNLGLIALIAAVLLTLLQGLMLRRQFPGPWIWTLASLGGWMVGYAAAMDILNASGLMARDWTPSLGTSQHALFAAIEGLIYSAATGVVLSWSLGAQPQAQVEPATVV